MGPTNVSCWHRAFEGDEFKNRSFRGNSMDGDDKGEIASTTVTKDDEGNVEATATTKGGSTGHGSSSPGVIDDASEEAAVEDAVKDAQ